MNLGGVWDWTFFWETFGFFLRAVAPFLLIIIAILAVGMLLLVVIKAVRSSRE